jgi:hypothetical protein
MARADRLREWSDKRTTSARATLAADDAQPYAHDIAFLTQPGRIPERTRMIAREDRAYASLAKASSMAARADGIERAADHAIFSDDDDAADALRHRIAGLEAQRDAITAYNASCRLAAKTGGHGDLALLVFDRGAGMENLQGMATSCAQAGQLRPGWALPAYATANISGNLSQQRARLARLKTE